MSGGLRFGLYFSAYFLTNGLMLAYWPVWLKDRGLEAVAIGTLLFAAQWIKVGGVLACGDFADRLGVARPLVIALSMAGLLVMAMFGLAEGFWPLLALTLLWGLAWPAILPIVDGQAMQLAAGGAFDYGRTRLWGSITFIAATIGGGYVLQRSGSDAVHGVIVASVVATALAAVVLPSANGGRAGAGPRRSAMFDLLRDPAFRAFLIAGGAAQVSHAVYYGFGTLEWRAMGLDDTAIGLLWAVGVLAEIVLFALGRRLAERVGVIRLLLVAGIAAVMRWALTPFIQDYVPLLAIQILHALTFGATHLAAMMFIQRRVDPGAVSSAQALYAALPIGLGMGLAMMGAGLLYEIAGGLAYLAMVALALLSLAGTAMLAKRWR